jgi:hypothetical protein
MICTTLLDNFSINEAHHCNLNYKCIELPIFKILLERLEFLSINFEQEVHEKESSNLPIYEFNRIFISGISENRINVQNFIFNLYNSNSRDF